MAKYKKYEEEKNKTISRIEHLKNAPGYALGIGIAAFVFLPITGLWIYENTKAKKAKKKEDSDI